MLRATLWRGEGVICRLQYMIEMLNEQNPYFNSPTLLEQKCHQSLMSKLQKRAQNSYQEQNFKHEIKKKNYGKQ